MEIVSKGFSILLGILLFALLLILIVLVVNSFKEGAKPHLVIAGSVIGMASFMNIKQGMKGMGPTVRLLMIVIIALIVIAIVFGLVTNVGASTGSSASDFIFGVWPF